MVDHVVLVHGLWMRGPCLAWLARGLRKRGYRTTPFSYVSTREPPAHICERLQTAIDALPVSTTHLLVHSMGGLIAAQMLRAQGCARIERVVALGTPFAGSSVAHWFDGWRLGRWMLGAARPTLLDSVPTWPGTSPLGVIAGDRPVGLGRICPHLAKPNDGTVAVAETEIAGAADRIVLRVSHTEMLLSASIVAHAARFFETGRFTPNGPGSGG